MPTIRHLAAIAAGTTFLVVSGCAPVMPTGEELVAQCQAQAVYPGTYEYEDGDVIPTVVPVEDGSEAGALAFNACIRAKAAEAGMITLGSDGRVGAACPDGAATIYGGATYCIGNN